MLSYGCGVREPGVNPGLCRNCYPAFGGEVRRPTTYLSREALAKWESRCRNYMSISIERPEITSFIKTWQNKPGEQIAEELASYSLETKGIPDPYYFTVSANGELFSPTAHCRIKDKVEDKTGPLGQLEYQAVLSIEQWAASSNEGSAVWVSPPYPGFYPKSKIIISEIEQKNGEKRLFNRAVRLDFDEKECLEFAQNLAQLSQNRPLLQCLDQVRATPFILNTHGNSWIYILQELIDDPALWQSIRNGEDQSAKKEAVRQAVIVQKELFTVSRLIYSDDAKVAITQMLGPGSGSCPVLFSTGAGKTAFQTFSESAVTFTGSTSKDPDFCIHCGACGEKINCVVRRGEKCPKCPAIRKC